jgi:adenylate cyclase
MAKKRRKISFSFKIFGLAVSILLLLVVVTYFTISRLIKINKDLTDLTEYIIPITDAIAVIDVHALEQQLHFERVLKLYEIEPINREHLSSERIGLEQRTRMVGEEIEQAIRLSKVAIDKAITEKDKQKFRDIEPMLERIEREHQDFHTAIVQVFDLLEQEEKTAAYQLENKIEEELNHFNQHMEVLLLEMEKFTVDAARTAETHLQRVLQLSLICVVIATVGGLLYAAGVTIGLVIPIRKLMSSMAAMKKGHLDAEVDISTRDEIGLLADGFNSMVGEIKQKEQIKDTFGRYVDPRVVEQIMASPETANIGGEKQVMTVFFSDVDGFDAIAKTLTPDELVDVTNKYLTLMSAPISEHTGVIDKFIGTIVMGFWGPPFTSEADHAQLACYAALDQLTKLGQLRRLISQSTRARTGLPDIKLRIGIATGSLVVGNMGSEMAKSYTVMGDTVNTASRLKGASKQYGISVMLSEDTQKQVAETTETREIDRIQLVGKVEPVTVYELLGCRGEVNQTAIELRDVFEQALSRYHSRDWDGAQRHFEACLHMNANDGPTQVYLERIHELRENPPPDDWNGVWRLTHK